MKTKHLKLYQTMQNNPKVTVASRALETREAIVTSVFANTQCVYVCVQVMSILYIPTVYIIIYNNNIYILYYYI